MASVKRGKALVASLRAQPGVRDPEALAAYLGRFKKARKAGASAAKAAHVASGGHTEKAVAEDRYANLKKGDKVMVKGRDGEHEVRGKTRDGKIKVLAPNRRDEPRVHPKDVFPHTRDGKSLNDRGSFGGQNADDSGYRGKNAPPLKKSSKDLVKAPSTGYGDTEPPSIGSVQRTVQAEANRFGYSKEKQHEVLQRRLKDLEKLRKAYLARQRRKAKKK